MNRFLFSLFMVASFSLVGFAQTDDKKAVLGVVNKLFDEMRAANAAGILATGTPENQLVAIRKLKDGKTRVDVINGEAFTKFFTKPNSIEELMYTQNVEVDGSHCGLVWNPAVLKVVADRLAHAPGAWRPYGDATEAEPARAVQSLN